MRHTHNFLLVALVLSIGIAPDLLAVPSVKVLGQKSANVGAAKTVDTTATATPKRSASANQLPRLTSVPVNKVTTKPVSVTKTSDPSRLSVGKYIHTTGVTSGVIKPIGGSSAGASSSDLVVITDRVNELELDLDGKQDKLTAGDGIKIDKDVISVSDDLTGLPTTVNNLSNQISTKVDVANLAESYYNKGETNQAIQDAISELTLNGTDTIYDYATQKRKYVSIVNVFDSAILWE